MIAQGLFDLGRLVLLLQPCFTVTANCAAAIVFMMRMLRKSTEIEDTKSVSSER